MRWFGKAKTASASLVLSVAVVWGVICLVSWQIRSRESSFAPEEEKTFVSDARATEAQIPLGMVTIVEVLPSWSAQSQSMQVLSATAPLATRSAGVNNSIKTERSGSFGTGFVLDGVVITNRHVVTKPAANYRVLDSWGQEHQVLEIFSSKNQDIAVLQVENLAAPTLILGQTENLALGEAVTVIGVEPGSLSHQSKPGKLTGRERSIQATGGLGGETFLLSGLLTTDAPIEPGSSGGVMLDSQGKVIGLNVATSFDGSVSFAIGVEELRVEIAQLRAL